MHMRAHTLLTVSVFARLWRGAFVELACREAGHFGVLSLGWGKVSTSSRE